MRYVTLCGRFSRDVYLHLPADAPFDPDQLVESDEPERWSRPGEPTIYLAGDLGVALAELGRHTLRLPPHVGTWRRIVRLHVGLERVLDLTRPETLKALGLEDGAMDLLDRRRTQALATDARSSGDCEGILVPSVAFLDQPSRWNLVVFADRLPDGFSAAIGPPVDVTMLTRLAVADEGDGGDTGLDG